MKHSSPTISQPSKTTPTDVVQWAHALAGLHARIAAHFARPEPRRRALAYLQGLLSTTERKNGWQLAEQAREATPYGMQRLLARASWNADLVRDEVRAYVLEHLGAPQAVLVLDETSFPKRGKKSAGVQKQYCGTTGEVEDCQVAVFLSYVSERGYTLIDRELYLPESWTDDRQRCREAHIPESISFLTKCELARRMVERIWAAQVPICWVVADTVYGDNLDLRTWLERHQYHYVLAVPCDQAVGLQMSNGRRSVQVQQVEALMALTPKEWHRLSMGQGSKGPRLYDWVALPILEQWVDDGQHFLLIRRSLNSSRKTTYYLVFAQEGTTLQEMVTAIGARWKIEENFETAKDLGLDHYEVRSFIAWYRHVTLVLLAHAFLTVICQEGQSQAPLEAASVSEPESCSPLQELLVEAPLTVPEVRHLLAHLIWPLPSSAIFVLAWSSWRRRHRSVACYHHTRRRLQAGYV